jgi:hypothetical protein
MQNPSDDRQDASASGDRALAGGEDEALAALIERSHGAGLTPEQATELRLSLASQTAALAVLRRYALNNDDAPCFIFTAVVGNADG